MSSFSAEAVVVERGLSTIDPAILAKLDAAASLDDRAHVLYLVQDSMSIANIIYHCPTLNGFNLENPAIATTHSIEWQNHYRKEKFIEIDPVYNNSAHTILPLDWAKIDRSSPKIKRFFSHALDSGVGRNGLTIPVRGPSNGMWALFGVSTQDNEREWDLRRRELLKDAMVLAHYIHQRAVEIYGYPGESFSLKAITPREREALSWSAEGKSFQDIATIMRISAETVKAHLDSARFKLGALTRTHAVVKALRAGIVR